MIIFPHFRGIICHGIQYDTEFGILSHTDTWRDYTTLRLEDYLEILLLPCVIVDHLGILLTILGY